MFEGARVSASSAARRARAARKRTPPRRCPGCRSELQHVTSARRRSSSARAATASGSTRDVFERICADRESQTAVLHRSRPARASRERPRPLPALPAVRKDDEPRELRQALGHGGRRVPRPRHVPRRRRAASDRRRSSRRADWTARARRQIEELRDEERKAIDDQRKAMRERGKQGGSEPSAIGSSGFEDLMDLLRGTSRD